MPDVDILKTETPFRDGARNMAYVLRATYRLSPMACLLTFLETVSQVASAFMPVVMGLIVSALAAHDASRLLLAVVLLILATSASGLLGLVGLHSRVTMQDRANAFYDERIARISGLIPTLEHLERPEYAEQLQILHDRRGSLGGAFNTLANCVHNLSTPIALVVIALGTDWRMIFLIVVALGFAIASRWLIAWDKQAEEAMASPGKLLTHLEELVLEPGAGAEVRVLGAQAQIIERIQRAALGWRRPIAAAETKSSLLLLALTVVYYTVALGVLGSMVHDTVAGDVGIGHLTAALASTARLRTTFTSIAPNISMLSTTSRTVARYRWLERHAAEVAAAHAGATPPPETLTDGIRLDHVSFAYPGSDRLALTDVSLDIPAGSVVAVVGENGAGKSTLVKVLTGMYDLADGQVLIDGVALSELDLPAWRARCSGAFQDHYRFQLQARESVGIGDLPRKDDDDAVRQAISDAAADDLLPALPQGLDTQLGSEWPDGVGLSGGQWQRVAIARGLMRREPLLLVLDEPTSALDAATEDRLFSGYAEAARQAGGHDGVTLLVTHRFSTVSAADFVVVLRDGRVAEQGTHGELMARAGAYAELYALQARGYAASGAAPAEVTA